MDEESGVVVAWRLAYLWLDEVMWNVVYWYVQGCCCCLRLLKAVKAIWMAQMMWLWWTIMKMAADAASCQRERGVLSRKMDEAWRCDGDDGVVAISFWDGEMSHDVISYHRYTKATRYAMTTIWPLEGNATMMQSKDLSPRWWGIRPWRTTSIAAATTCHTTVFPKFSDRQ
jgi:hypothetical protein